MATHDDAKGKPRDPKIDKVDEASRESFPASDPPANQPLHPGLPGKHPDKKPDRKGDAPT